MCPNVIISEIALIHKIRIPKTRHIHEFITPRLQKHTELPKPRANTTKLPLGWLKFYTHSTCLEAICCCGCCCCTESYPQWGVETADDDEEGEAADDVDVARPTGPTPRFRLGPAPPPPPDCIKNNSNFFNYSSPQKPNYYHKNSRKKKPTNITTQIPPKKTLLILIKPLFPSDPNVQKKINNKKIN